MGTRGSRKKSETGVRRNEEIRIWGSGFGLILHFPNPKSPDPIPCILHHPNRQDHHLQAVENKPLL